MSLATRYLGLELAHPIVASASPLTSTLDGMRRLEDAGAAAVVMASLYEEQIRAEDTAYALYTEHGSNSQAEAGSYFPDLPGYDSGVSGHLETLRCAREALEIPVIASLNGTTAEGWVGHARALEQAGAAAIELNVYSVPVDFTVSGNSSVLMMMVKAMMPRPPLLKMLARPLSDHSMKSTNWSHTGIAAGAAPTSWPRCVVSRATDATATSTARLMPALSSSRGIGPKEIIGTPANSVTRPRTPSRPLDTGI